MAFIRALAAAQEAELAGAVAGSEGAAQPQHTQDIAAALPPPPSVQVGVQPSVRPASRHVEMFSKTAVQPLPATPSWLADSASEDDEGSPEHVAAADVDDSDDDGMLGGVDVLATWAAQAHVQKRVPARQTDTQPVSTLPTSAPCTSTQLHTVSNASAPHVKQHGLTTSLTATLTTSLNASVALDTPPVSHLMHPPSSTAAPADPLPFPLAGARARSKGPPQEGPRFWCAVCQVACTSLTDWQQHHQVRTSAMIVQVLQCVDQELTNIAHVWLQAAVHTDALFAGAPAPQSHWWCCIARLTVRAGAPGPHPLLRGPSRNLRTLLPPSDYT